MDLLLLAGTSRDLAHSRGAQGFRRRGLRRTRMEGQVVGLSDAHPLTRPVMRPLRRVQWVLGPKARALSPHRSGGLNHQEHQHHPAHIVPHALGLR